VNVARLIDSINKNLYRAAAMARIHTHYDNLKVARDAPPEVIRAAYKTLSQKYHPDRHGNSAEAIRIIQIINSAYAVLSDPAKRREHDEWIVRNEATSHRIGEPEFRECSVPQRPIRARSSRRSHRRHSLAYYYMRYEMSLQRAAHKLRIMLDRYSRKLFRKT
jgi:curved DNA-binding protein CbpA